MTVTNSLRWGPVAVLAISLWAPFACTVAAEPAFHELMTAIVRDNVLYAAAVNPTDRIGGRLAVVPLADASKARVLFLPLRAASAFGRYPFAWDMHGEMVYFTSILEPAPAQHTFTLAGLPLEKLRPIDGPADPSSTDANAIMPNILDEVANVWPISNAYIKTAVSGTGGSVYFDLKAVDDHTFDVHILSHSRLEIWRGGGRNWVSTGSFTWKTDGPFAVAGDVQKRYLVSDAGRVHLVEQEGLREIGSWPGKDVDGQRILVLQENGAVSLLSIDEIMDASVASPRGFIVRNQGLVPRNVTIPLRAAVQQALRSLEATR